MAADSLDVNTGTRRNPTVVLLTASYPFGNKAETFLDAELPILARRFSRVIVLPSQREPGQRALPPGVECVTLLADASATRVRREILRNAWPMSWRFLRAVVEERRPANYLRHPRIYLHLLAQSLAKFRLLRAFIEAERLQDALFYDYWLENSTLALAWLRRAGIIRRAVARAHSFDLYDERSPTGASPFRRFKVASLDRVFAISAHGLAYLLKHTSIPREKLVLSRLGVEAPRKRATRTHDDQESRPLVVSCASLLPFKRVEHIPAVLAEIGRPLRWIHFGDGPLRREVEAAAQRLPASVSWRLAGHVDHAELLRFYATHWVNLFISLTSIEGLPVSMMEAISHGIPILATRVYGVPEIVTDETGALVELGEPPSRIAAVARRMLDGGGPGREQVVAFFEAHFEAELNFDRFVELLNATD